MLFCILKDVKISESINLYLYQCKWRNCFVVSILKNKTLTVLFIRFIPTVYDLITSAIHVDTLTIRTSKLIISTSRKFKRNVIGLPFVTFWKKVLKPGWAHGESE